MSLTTAARAATSQRPFLYVKNFAGCNKEPEPWELAQGVGKIFEEVVIKPLRGERFILGSSRLVSEQPCIILIDAKKEVGEAVDNPYPKILEEAEDRIVVERPIYNFARTVFSVPFKLSYQAIPANFDAADPAG